MKFVKLLLLFSVLNSPLAIAQSTLVGTWVDGGDRLLVQIVDDPSESNLVAGQIWNSISNSQQSINTGTLEIKCGGQVTVPTGKPFGSCKLYFRRSACIDHDQKWGCGIWKDEASKALQFFKPYARELTIKSSSEDFIFQTSSIESFVGIVIYKNSMHE
jgi:hypothetical protein